MNHYTTHQFLALESERSGLFAEVDESLNTALAHQAATANNHLRRILVAETALDSGAAIAEARMHIAQLDHELSVAQDPLARLRSLILAEEDVKELIKLEVIGGKYWYLIKSTFQEFPYVIGITDADNERVQVRLKCQAGWQADLAWKRLQATGSPESTDAVLA
jgi:hypothetical protein